MCMPAVIVVLCQGHQEQDEAEQQEFFSTRIKPAPVKLVKKSESHCL